ncbi:MULTISPECIES: SHOCT domain-containing protein [Rhodococcus]|uniref:SHOCT domain-containing protein n=1 Tax=Rhodococcus TaxID=1827 RepID=UPI001A247B14|nr:MULTISPECIES: SHOCT domain-containing protein [Rhodococcus]MBJ7476430.1 SHOCT domain-containing protein [Rhodococcus sp. (in: high G+C Gram-positive bacteria)]MBT2263801.1 SHOCT domain-containing protein [Rhodococcus erythropolis]
MPYIPRRGRPGLLGLAARTAVVTGTATAVSDGMATRRQRRAQAEYEHAQYEFAQQQAVLPIPTPTPTPTASVDLVAELQKLGDLKSQGLLSESEFEAAKARLLG